VKKTPLKDFSNVMARGIIAIAIDKDDELISAGLTNGKQTIFLATRDGMAIRFDEEYDPERSGIRPAPHGPQRRRQPRHLAQEGRLRDRRGHHELRPAARKRAR
jgi:DNA gyrase/topoisomerase IV subunit A